MANILVSIHGMRLGIDARGNLILDGNVIAGPDFSAGSSLPAQSGQNGKFLKTDGTNASWAATPYLQPAAGTLADAASIAWDLAAIQLATVTLGGNRTLANPANLAAGAYLLIARQDGTGSRTLAYGNKFKWPGGVAPTLSTAANAADILSFVSDGTNLYGNAQLAFA